jgi:hypothetical protein
VVGNIENPDQEKPGVKTDLGCIECGSPKTPSQSGTHHFLISVVEMLS